jgi:hypothetical protein
MGKNLFLIQVDHRQRLRILEFDGSDRIVVLPAVTDVPGSKAAVPAARWLLNQVQHDEFNGTKLASTPPGSRTAI